MRKLDGFIELRRRGLPTPQLRLVRNAAELDKTDWRSESAPVGWMVRSYLEAGGNELGLPCKAFVDEAEVGEVIEGFRQQTEGKCLFNVYPSWESLASGNIFLKGNESVLEYAQGWDFFVKNRIPTTVKLSRSSGEILSATGEHWLEKEDLEFVLDRAWRLHPLDCVAEWSKTADGNILFFDLRLLRDFKRV